MVGRLSGDGLLTFDITFWCFFGSLSRFLFIYVLCVLLYFRYPYSGKAVGWIIKRFFVALLKSFAYLHDAQISKLLWAIKHHTLSNSQNIAVATCDEVAIKLAGKTKYCNGRQAMEEDLNWRSQWRHNSIVT